MKAQDASEAATATASSHPGRLISHTSKEVSQIDSNQNEPTMNSTDRTDDALDGVESNRSDNNDQNGVPMSDTTPSTTQTDRIPAAATSAVTRDAARLRSVMSDLRREGPVAADGAPPEELMPVPAYLETVMPAPRAQATELRAPAPAARPKAGMPAAHAQVDDKSRATRLRSVASLVEMRLADEQRATRTATTMPMPDARPPAGREQAERKEGPVRHLEIPVYEPEPDGPRYSSGGEGRVRVLMALAGTVVAGLVIGVGLYAGGGELLSAIFTSDTAMPAEPNPAAITERPIMDAPAPIAIDSPMTAEQSGEAIAQTHSHAGGQMATTESEPTPQTAPEPPLVLEDRLPGTQAQPARVEAPAADVVTGSPKSEPVPTRADAKREKRTTPKADETSIGGNPAATRAAVSKTYTVQVGATSDQAEARKIAKRLKGKGVRDVEVVKSEKNGAPLYRVRFKSEGTARDAQAAAGRAGYDDAWIVRN